MKKVLGLALVAVTFAACNSTTDNHNGTTGTTNTDTETTTTTSTSNNAAYAPGEGDVTRRNGRVMIYREGQWADADNDVRLDDGSTVNRNGRVTRDGREVELQEGEVVDKTGRFFDRAGNAIENAWDKTKEGAKELGRDVGNAAEKAGDKIENATDNDRRR